MKDEIYTNFKEKVKTEGLIEAKENCPLGSWGQLLEIPHSRRCSSPPFSPSSNNIGWR